jgi:hypothetical protein
LYIFGGDVMGVVVAVLVMVCVSVSSECCGYERRERRKKGGVSACFMSKDVVRGYRRKGNALIVEYGLVLGSMPVEGCNVDFCCDVEVDVNLESARGGEILFGCDFICYAPVEGIVVDVGGIVKSSLSFPGKFWNDRAWLYEFYVGVMGKDVIFQPSLYCIYGLYAEEVALEGRVERRWDLLPLGLRDFMLGFTGEVGWDYAGKPNGLPYASSLGRRDYWYYGIAFSLIYKLAVGEASIGVSYEGNTAEKYSWVNRGKGYKDNVWFNALLNFSF